MFIRTIRRHVRAVLCGLLVVALAGCEDGGGGGSSPLPAVPAGDCVAVEDVATGQHEYERVAAGDLVRFLLFVPHDYTDRAAWPLILFLHGSGESGDDLSLVKKYGPPKNVESDPSFPFIVLSPQNRTGDWWSSAMLLDLLDQVACQFRVDRSRIYVTGLSLGGYGTWSLAVADPGRFAAIAPVSGAGSPSSVGVLANLPVWAFHGALDPTVPVTDAQAMVDALRASGGDVDFTVYPDGGHDVWNQTYDAPNLYDWFLQHTREP